MFHVHYKGVAADFDGTLVDSDKAHQEARLAAYEELAIELEEPRLADIDPEIHAEGHHHGSNSHAINAWIIEQAGLSVEGVDLAAEVVTRKKANYARIAENGLEPRPGAVDFMMALLRRWQEETMIATTANLGEVEAFLGSQGLQSSFTRRQLVTAEDVDSLKPDPEVYYTVMARLGLTAQPQKLLVVEDTPLGIEAANRAGATTVGVLTPEYGDKLLAQRGIAKPDHIAGSLPEVSDMLHLL